MRLSWRIKIIAIAPCQIPKSPTPASGSKCESATQSCENYHDLSALSARGNSIASKIIQNLTIGAFGNLFWGQVGSQTGPRSAWMGCRGPSKTPRSDKCPFSKSVSRIGLSHFWPSWSPLEALSEGSRRPRSSPKSSEESPKTSK